MIRVVVILCLFSATALGQPVIVEPLPTDVVTQCAALLEDYDRLHAVRPKQAPKRGPACDKQADAALPAALAFCRAVMAGGERLDRAPLVSNQTLGAATQVVANARPIADGRQSLVPLKHLADDDSDRGKVYRQNRDLLDKQLDALELCKARSRQQISGGIKLGSFLPQDAILQGLANVIGARLKAELALALQDRLLRRVCRSSHAGTVRVAWAFESTCKLLGQLEGGESLRPPPWSVIRSAVRADLDALPGRIVRVVSKQTGSEVARAMALAVDILDKVRQGRDLISVVKALRPQMTADLCKVVDVACFRLLVADLFVVVSGTGSPADPRPYARIALARLKAIPALGPVWQTGDDAVRIEALIEVRALIQEVRALVDDGIKQPASLDAYLKQVSVYLQKVAHLLRASALVVTGTEDCGGCVAGAVADAADSAAALLVAVTERDYPTALLHLLALFDNADGAAPEWLLDYGPFLAELAASKDAASAEKIIEAAAAPVGSYRAKRDHGFTLTLSAFPGIQVGQEWLTNDDLKVGTGAASHIGLFAPIGLDLAWALPGEGSIGVFVSVLDLGALVDFRFDGEPVEAAEGDATGTAEASPQVGFGQVVSPGAYLNIGIWKTPLVLGFGAAYSPKLRKINGSLSVGEASAFQMSGYLAVDVSLFSITR